MDDDFICEVCGYTGPMLDGTNKCPDCGGRVMPKTELASVVDPLDDDQFTGGAGLDDDDDDEGLEGLRAKEDGTDDEDEE